MTKYRILQKCDKFFIQEYAQQGLIFKNYTWQNLGSTIGCIYSLFSTKYYDSLDEAKAKVTQLLDYEIRQEQWETSPTKVVYETK